MLTVSLFIHVAGAVILAGGIHFLHDAVGPLLKNPGNADMETVRAMGRKFLRMAGIATALLLLTGMHLAAASGHLKDGAAPFLMAKILLALVVFMLSMGPAMGWVRGRGRPEQSLLWLRVSLLLALVVIFLGVWITAGKLPD